MSRETPEQTKTSAGNLTDAGVDSFCGHNNAGPRGAEALAKLRVPRLPWDDENQIENWAMGGMIFGMTFRRWFGGGFDQI